MESVFDCVVKVLQILFDKFKSSIVDSMCNLLIAVFHGKFSEAVDLGEKEKLEIPGGWGGGCSKTLRNANSRGVGGSKVKNLPWGGGGGVWIFSGTAHYRPQASRCCLVETFWSLSSSHWQKEHFFFLPVLILYNWIYLSRFCMLSV